MQNSADLAKVKQFCEEWDPYGYGLAMRNIPMDNVDDIRNLLVLCQEHHTGGTTDGIANGVHNITFSSWLMQKLARQGIEPIPIKKEN